MENIAIFQENMSLVTCGQTFTDLPSGRNCFHCFSTIIDQPLIPESFKCVCVTGEKPGLRTGQVTGSVQRSQQRGQTAQQRTELCPTAPSVMLGHTAITLLLHNTGAECIPPRHTQKYTHHATFLN